MALTIIPFNVKDYLDEARGRYTMQFENKTVFDRYIQLLLTEPTELQQVFKDLMQKRTLNTAQGYYLDVIGIIVGQPRILVNVDFLQYFGMIGNPRSNEMGDLNTNTGGKFKDMYVNEEGSISLDDETYRIMLKAKIAKNSTRATPEEMMTFLNFVFNTNSSYITDGGAKVVALVSDVLTPQQTLLLQYVNRTGRYDVTLFPKPVGVGIEYGFFDPDEAFIFDEVPIGKGFGDVSDPMVDGGVFASLYQNV